MSDQPTSLQPENASPAIREFLELLKNIDKDDPAPADVQAIRDILRAHPDLWRLAGDLAHAAALSVIDRFGAPPVLAESLKRGWGAMKDQLGYETASPLERLLIEQVVLCWLHLSLVQLEYTGIMREPIPTSSADHWERRLSAAQSRYLRACDALARIRKLARTTPALQVNIATTGGQQVNLLGGD